MNGIAVIDQLTDRILRVIMLDRRLTKAEIAWLQTQGWSHHCFTIVDVITVQSVEEIADEMRNTSSFQGE